MKACFKCKYFKPHEAFYANAAMRDGFMGKCKECTKADVRSNYHEHIERYRAYEKTRAMAPHRVEAREAYAKTDRGKAKVYAARRRYIERNPIKRQAHNMVNNAMRDGLIVRQPCETCGSEKTQAHHDDYSKPLNVRWLCTKHHAEWHRHNTPLCPDQENAA